MGTVSLDVIIAYALGLLLLYLLGYLLLTPLKLLMKFLLNGVAGGLMLILLNAFGSLISIGIAINPVTALIAGFLGLPGIALMLVVQAILM